MTEEPTDRRGDSPAGVVEGVDAGDGTDGSAAGDADTSTTDAGTSGTGGDTDAPRVAGDGGARDVVVSEDLYKRITTYSTLAAIVTVVLGFVLLDAATLQVSYTRRFVVAVLSTGGLTLSRTALTATFSVLGLASIAFGAGVYVLGTRFRAEGMGPDGGAGARAAGSEPEDTGDSRGRPAAGPAENGNSQDDDPEE